MEPPAIYHHVLGLTALRSKTWFSLLEVWSSPAPAQHLQQHREHGTRSLAGQRTQHPSSFISRSVLVAIANGIEFCRYKSCSSQWPHFTQGWMTRNLPYEESIKQLQILIPRKTNLWVIQCYFNWDIFSLITAFSSVCTGKNTTNLFCNTSLAWKWVNITKIHFYLQKFHILEAYESWRKK